MEPISVFIILFILKLCQRFLLKLPHSKIIHTTQTLLINTFFQRSFVKKYKGLSQKSGTEEAMAPFATRLERRNPLLSRLLKDVATPLIASGVSQKVKNRPF
jgi:hypothetical protein